MENKGLRTRNAKQAKNSRKALIIKENQKGICHFVNVKWQIIKRINGKYRHTGEHKDYGLQVENKVYLADGSYKLVNSKNFKITKVYDDIPEWANSNLIKKYNIFYGIVNQIKGEFTDVE